MKQRMIRILLFSILCTMLLPSALIASAKEGASPSPSASPQVTSSPQPTDVPKPTAKPTSKPESTEIPDYSRLLSLSDTSVTTTAHTTFQLYLRGAEEAPGYSETWSTENNALVSVDQTGKVTIHSETSEAGVKVFDKVTIGGRVYELSCTFYVSEPGMVSSSVTLRPGKTSQINVLGLLAQSSVTYQTSNPGIALVTETGMVTAISAGQTVIKIVADGVTFDYTVIVSNAKINCTWFLTRVGKTKQLTVSGKSGSTPVTYSTSNQKIATVSTSGLITAKKRGNATVTISVDGLQFTCVVNITYKKALNVINSGKKKLGIKYSQARRMSSNYFDCSSFVYRMYRKQKIYFGNRRYAPTAAEEARYMVLHKKVIAYKYVNCSKLLPGDVLFIKGSYNGRYRNICHTAIYIGNGKILHSTPPYVQYGLYDKYKTRISVIARPCK